MTPGTSGPGSSGCRTGGTDLDRGACLDDLRPRYSVQSPAEVRHPGHESLRRSRSRVKKGDPLVELRSTDLASAKSDFQTKFVQWQHDKKLYDLRQKLFQTGAISQQLGVETQNNEQKSRLDHDLARDKLQVYDVSDQEIQRLITLLREKPADGKPLGDKEDKSRFTLAAKTEGIVIERAVVPGNFYNTGSEFMAIAPLDHLWVVANVPEKHRDQLRAGQTLELDFPLLQPKIEGKVEYVANEVSPDTGDVRIRTSIRTPSFA